MVDGTPGPEDVLRTTGTKPISSGDLSAGKENVRPFAPYMQGGQPNPLLASGKTPQISPFELARGQVAAAGPNFSTLQDQAKMATSTLGDISNQLNTPNLKLKQSTKYLLKNKLTSAKGHILSASNKLGAKPADEKEEKTGGGPLQKFLNLVSNGQNQLQNAQTQLAALSTKGEEMRPADLLLIQIKLSKAQQELEYSSLLLGKAVDDLKMMMNIQL